MPQSHFVRHKTILGYINRHLRNAVETQTRIRYEMTCSEKPTQVSLFGQCADSSPLKFQIGAALMMLTEISLKEVPDPLHCLLSNMSIRLQTCWHHYLEPFPVSFILLDSSTKAAQSFF